MTTAKSESAPDKFRRYRAAKREQGLREIRLWVPDTRNPDILARLKRDGDILRGLPQQAEANEFFGGHFDDMFSD